MLIALLLTTALPSILFSSHLGDSQWHWILTGCTFSAILTVDGDCGPLDDWTQLPSSHARLPSRDPGSCKIALLREGKHSSTCAIGAGTTGSTHQAQQERVGTRPPPPLVNPHPHRQTVDGTGESDRRRCASYQSRESSFRPLHGRNGAERLTQQSGRRLGTGAENGREQRPQAGAWSWLPRHPRPYYTTSPPTTHSYSSLRRVSFLLQAWSTCPPCPPASPAGAESLALAAAPCITSTACSPAARQPMTH